jgi:hypothetical protein
MSAAKMDRSPLTKLEREAVQAFTNRIVKEYGGRLVSVDLCGHEDPSFEETRDIQLLVLTRREDGELEDLAMDMVLDILLDTGIYLTVKTFSRARFETFRKAEIPMIRKLDSDRVSLWIAA